ncbi:YhdP family protein [Pseudidiomarina insulisalsae]|uniref:TIGR02099 family protein n=1 Tax=Pseudidiomarina insulisalsae TaxID=575789 RepID=A0A432YNG2_9GAMM|nr:YhdP family protein [Pseudidiomarina insulisalsae]RUO62438.1 TIGR02099 family protein [Pseudidiomarina insulisalsae]
MWRVSFKVAYRTLLYTAATTLVLFAVLLSILRYLLPQLPDVTTQVEDFFAENYAVELTISQLGADWNVAGPQLILQDIEVQRLDGESAQLQLNEARVIFNFWQSLRTWSLKFEQIALADLHVTYDLRDSSWGGNSGVANDLPRFFLNQLDQVTIQDSTLELINLVGVRRAIEIEQLSWNNQGRSHQGIGSLRIAELAPNSLDVIIDVEGNDPADLAGQIYIKAKNLDIAGYLQQKIIDAEVSQAEFNFTLWLNFSASDFRNGILQLGRNELHWQVDDRRHQLVIPKGLLELRPHEDGWLVNNNPITFIQDRTTWTLPTVSWLQTPELFAFSAEAVPVAPLLQLASLAGSEGQQWADQLKQAELQGELDIHLQQPLQQPLQWQASARQLAWQEMTGVPGLNGVALQVRGQDRKARWQLSGEAIPLESDSLVAGAAWQLQRLQLGGDLDWSDAGWQVQVDADSRADLEGLPLRLAARLDYRDRLYIAARLSDASEAPIPAAVLRRYLPEVMGGQLHDYLQTALLEANATDLAMVWRGPLNEFPYHDGTGVFQAQATLQDLVYRFQPDWPAINDATTYVHFANERMHILTENALLEGVQLERVDTVIDDILARPLSLSIRAGMKGEGARLQPIFAASPLADSLGQAFGEIQLAGQFIGELDLTIPLDGSNQVTAKGYVDLNDNDLYVAAIDQRFHDLQGRIRYQNEVINAEQLQLSWNQLPLAVDLQGGLREQDYQVRLDVTADWSMNKLATRQPLTTELASGQLQWQGKLALSLPQQGGYSFHWQQQSELENFALHLPAPLALDQGESMPWQLQVSGGPQSLLINSTLGEHSLLELQYNADASELRQGYARIGDRVSQLPNPDLIGLNPRFAMEIGLGDLDAQVWLDKLGTLRQWLAAQSTGSVTNGHTIAQPIPDVIEVQADRIFFGGHQLTENSLVVWPQQEPQAEQTIDTWRFKWRAREAAMQGTYWPQEAAQGERIEVNADYLELAKPEAEPQEVATELVEDTQQLAGFSRWPRLVFDCKRCRYGAYQLGEVAFNLEPEAQTLRITDIQLRNDQHQLNAELEWNLATAEQDARTAFSGEFNSDDFGDFLSDYEITSIIQDSPAQFDFALNWQGAPDEFNVASLNGNMDWRLGQGYLSDVSDGGARIFSMLSLESILRKLRFDFRDIFANGMFFTEFVGQFEIDDGVVKTDGARMNGAAGDMEITGQSNLVNNSLDYELFFVPKVTSSLPVILAWMVNPPSGLAALLIDQMLQDAQVISRLEYKITGTIDDPVVKEISRASREVDIPVDQLPQQQEDPDVEAENSATDSGTNDQPAGPAAESGAN